MDYFYRERHPPTQLAAMVAHTQVVPEDQTWFADSGANSHLTAKLGNLSLQEPFQGPETVSVGNGLGLPIAHIGSSSFSTPSTCFNLKQILHCPSASANLLSIQKF